VDEVQRWESGRTVRQWRDRVAPEAVGAPVGRRRRAAGLRREELAGLAVEPHHDHGRRKVVDHPGVGLIALDCDTLIVAAEDLRITIYTAEPGTEDSERLALAVVLSSQALVD
jgi:MmyB-like transcription regulator ligand binding domain